MDLDKDYWRQFDSLILDRDGTINVRIREGYVLRYKDFTFIHGVKEALYRLSNYFERIIIVTNQQGVGKGLMTIEELNDIHHLMIEEISEAGGRIDQIYSCTELAAFDPFCRKPNIGMGIQAKQDFPGLDFTKAVMVGDTASDILFGLRLKMMTVQVGSDNWKGKPYPHHKCTDLLAFAKWWEAYIKS